MNMQSLLKVMGMLCVLFTGSMMAQTARVQIIHNSPDAGPVDIYVNGSVAVPALEYRDATGFVELPTTVTVSVGIAGTPAPLPGTDIDLSLMENETYVVFANGAIDTTVINTDVANDNGVSAFFQYGLFEGHDTTATAGNVSITAAHGAIDADSVDILANGGVLVDNVSFPVIGGPLVVPTQDYVLQVTPYNDNETIVLDASFVADLDGLGLDGQGIVVFASGYVDPSANDDGPAFGLFAVTKAGNVVALPLAGNARAQVIHNAADLDATTVDIYVDLKTDTVKFDDVDFRAALPFTDLPTGYEIEIGVAGANSADITESLATFPFTLMDGESYYVIAQGILPGNEGDYDTDTNMGETGFTLVAETGAREAAANASEFDLNVFHGSTDAPDVDVVVNGDFSNVPITDLTYKEFTGYIPLAPAVYELGVGASTVSGPGDVLATFEADLSGAAGGAGLILASGFLSPPDNNEGPGLGLLFVQPNGDATLLSTVTSIRDLEVNNKLISVYPNPANGAAFLNYQVKEAGEVSVEVFDTQGRAVLRRSLDQVPGDYEMTIDTDELSAGLHILTVTTQSTRSTQRLIVK